MKRSIGMGRSAMWAMLAATALITALLGCGRYMKLDGAISRVRVVETGSARNVLVVEFDVTNTARVAYVVRDAELEIPDGDGALKGATISVQDAQTICQHIASLNHDCAQPLITREEIAAGATVRRMVAASFPKAAKELEERQGLTLRIRELDRLETEIREKR